MKVIFGHPLWQKHGLKFFRFAVCGGLGACVDFGSLYIFVHILGIPEKYAFVGSTGLAMIFVFFANRFFTFRASGSTGNQAIKFLAVYLVAGFLNYVYAPYVPLIVTPTIFAPEDFTPRKGVMTRYAKKVVRSDFYGVVTILDMNII